MKLTRLITVAFILGSVSTTALYAQTRPGSEPAEFPPSSYKGKQYVDSAGCVFIRAGIDGNISWVPRVTRKRSGVCGFKPTFAGNVTPPAPAPVQTAAAEQITVAPAAPVVAPKSRVTVPAAAKPVVRAAPKPRVVAKRAPKVKQAPKVVRQVAQRRAPIVEKSVQPQRVVKTARVVKQPAQHPRAAVQACAGASVISSRYLQAGRLAVRCGPQTAPIVGSRISAAPAPRTAAAAQQRVAVAAPAAAPVQRTQRISQHRRIVPRHVAVNRVNTTNVHVPRGYKRVWNDGRLNPKRAEQSIAGFNKMNLMWTSTVPRRLINQATGADVTASVPLVYPYVDYAAQQKQLGQVTIVQRQGQTLKRIVRNATNLVTPQPRQARTAVVQRQPVYSTRSTPKAAPRATAKRTQPKAEVAGAGFVQVGTFSSSAAAQRQAQKIQRMGLPVRVGRYTRNGQTTRLVIAGPFGGQNGVNRAINQLRRAGFNAFAR